MGQWAATREDLFPSQFCRELGYLHAQNKPHSFSYTKKVVENALNLAFGVPLSIHDVFLEFNSHPIGVGAIAQVYRAKFRHDIQVTFTGADGSEDRPSWVAVKVIHPNAEVDIRRDLHILAIIASLIDVIPTLGWLSIPDEVRTFSEMMLTQLDMRVEARNLDRFKHGFRYRFDVRFPRAIKGMGTKQVLMEEFIEAVPMSAFIACRRESLAMDKPDGSTPTNGAFGTVYDAQISGIGLQAFLVSF